MRLSCAMGDYDMASRGQLQASRPRAINFYDATVFQIFSLKCIGFLHLDVGAGNNGDRGWKVLANHVLTACGVLLIISGITQIPFATYNFRGVVILTILLLKRRQWTKLVCLVNRMLFDTFLTRNAAQKKLRQWQVLSIGAAIVTLFLQIVFETLNNLQYMAIAKKSMMSDGILDPLPLSMLVWQYVVFWTVCSALPFYLSQQVAICLLVIGKMLADCCRILTDALAEEMENVKILPGIGSSVVDLHLLKSELQRVDALQDAAERVINLKLRYLDMCRVVGYMDHHFGSFIFFLYGLDLLTMFGSVCSIVENNDKGIVVVRAYYYVSTVIFILYCTLFMWPLVMAYEESLKVNVTLHHFISKVEAIASLTTMQGRHLHAILQTFVIASKDRLLLFSGAEILHITRTFIFTTFTLLISFIVITKEVLQRDDSPRSCQTTSVHPLSANRTLM
ncbi:hypothetical protein BV898_09077 [Hypsibius exemplaris]|uniref:Gustatory receptor n=1 Tax=Hypsibius exemplaris TaxID=2072580 RepID=A0A1W0WP28_HYPEX|nr:hypothetical protein BV898_09077 [Hypsibius exemplaris]